MFRYHFDRVSLQVILGLSGGHESSGKRLRPLVASKTSLNIKRYMITINLLIRPAFAACPCLSAKGFFFPCYRDCVRYDSGHAVSVP
jgi:hypothetical protein